MPCYSPLKGWRNAETGGIVFRRDSGREPMEVACGQCLGCRLDRSRHWAMRIVHEAGLPQHVRGNCFVTLTYDDDKLPSDWSLDKAHFQKFMKRLRKHFGGEIRFFHAGEYGNTCRHGFDLSIVKCPWCSVGRPHYHACLFNCGFSDLEPYDSHCGDLRFTSGLLESIWSHGFVDVGDLNFESAAYVARYVMKKVTGKAAQEHYMYIDEYGVCTFLQPEYCTMSRRPGIGKDWFDKYKSDLYPSDEVPVVGRGVLKGVPRYYDELFKREDPVSFEEIKEMRKKYKDENLEEFQPARLMAKYKVKKAQVEMLRRRV